MIRKIVNIAFAVLMLIISTGFTVSVHYCHNNLVDVAIDKEAESCCLGGNCCKTETIVVKIEDEAVAQATAVVPAITSLDVLLPVLLNFSILNLGEQKFDKFFEVEASPPPKIQTVLSKLQTYLL